MQNEVMVTVCDSELLGKVFREGELKLEVNRSFYDGNEAGIEECLGALKGATIGNLVGSIVEQAVEAGFINPANILRIQGIPHAQFVRF
jgi:hypothetical protein